MSCLTLTQALVLKGYTHRKSTSGATYAHDILDGSLVVFTGTAAETWAWLNTPDQPEDRSMTETHIHYFNILPCPHTGLARHLSCTFGDGLPRWAEHRADGTELSIDLYEASALRQAAGD